MKNKIKKEIVSLADEEYKKFHSNLCPGINNILGVRVPILREYAKSLNKKYSIQELLTNIDDEYNEEIMLQGMLIGLNKNEDLSVILNYIKKFVPKIDNWGVCDTFCARFKNN